LGSGYWARVELKGHGGFGCGKATELCFLIFKSVYVQNILFYKIDNRKKMTRNIDFDYILLMDFDRVEDCRTTQKVVLAIYEVDETNKIFSKILVFGIEVCLYWALMLNASLDQLRFSFIQKMLNVAS
jgi:hypothetical protein